MAAFSLVRALTAAPRRARDSLAQAVRRLWRGAVALVLIGRRIGRRIGHAAARLDRLSVRDVRLWAWRGLPRVLVLTLAFWMGYAFRSGVGAVVEVGPSPDRVPEPAAGAAWAQAYCARDAEALVAVAPAAYADRPALSVLELVIRCLSITYLGGAPETDLSYGIAAYVWHGSDPVGEQYGLRVLTLESGRIVRVR